MSINRALSDWPCMNVSKYLQQFLDFLNFFTLASVADENESGFAFVSWHAPLS